MGGLQTYIMGIVTAFYAHNVRNYLKAYTKQILVFGDAEHVLEPYMPQRAR